MISINSAREIIEKAASEKAIKVSDFKNKYYLFLMDGAAPFFIVDKNTGDWRLISPLEDFHSFAEAITKKVLKEF